MCLGFLEIECNTVERLPFLAFYLGLPPPSHACGDLADTSISEKGNLIRRR